jgi:PTS system N-acetylglucosamine-specific IIA component
VPDPVFAAGVVGPGLALEPSDGTVQVLAPVDGTVSSLHPHAFVIRSDVDRERAVLVHLGVDTVELDGVGFEPQGSVGDHVHAGDLVTLWDVTSVRASGRSVLCPVVLLQADPTAVEEIVPPAARVVAGDGILTWRSPARG